MELIKQLLVGIISIGITWCILTTLFSINLKPNEWICTDYMGTKENHYDHCVQWLKTEAIKHK